MKRLVVFFADDSIVARRKIAEVFDKLGVKHKHATNGLKLGVVFKDWLPTHSKPVLRCETMFA